MGRKVQNGASLVVGGYVRVWATGGVWDALITIPQAQARADERITVQTAGQSDPGSCPNRPVLE